MTISDATIEALIQSNKGLSESVRALASAVHAVLELSGDGQEEVEGAEVERYMDGTPVSE